MLNMLKITIFCKWNLIELKWKFKKSRHAGKHVIKFQERLTAISEITIFKK